MDHYKVCYNWYSFPSFLHNAFKIGVFHLKFERLYNFSPFASLPPQVNFLTTSGIFFAFKFS